MKRSFSIAITLAETNLLLKSFIIDYQFENKEDLPLWTT